MTGTSTQFLTPKIGYFIHFLTPVLVLKLHFSHLLIIHILDLFINQYVTFTHKSEIQRHMILLT